MISLTFGLFTQVSDSGPSCFCFTTRSFYEPGVTRKQTNNRLENNKVDQQTKKS